MLKRLGQVTVLALLLSALPAQAAFIEFTDRNAWLAAVGTTTGGEDFESFASDTSFSGGSVALSDGMSLGTMFNGGSYYNKVDVPAIQTVETDVNGSAHARLFHGLSAVPILPYLDFGGAVTAFGADMKNLNDDIARTSISLFNNGTSVATLTPPCGAYINGPSTHRRRPSGAAQAPQMPTPHLVR